MKRVVVTLLIAIALLAAGAGALYWGYEYFIVGQIKDGGMGMTNPFIEETKVQPAEGTELVLCSVTKSGEMAEDNYNYTLEKDGEDTLLYADYVAADGTRITIEGQTVEATALTGLNTLVLSMDLTETHYQDDPDKPFLTDGGKKQYTLSWDDGTTATPDDGFDAVNNYFETEVLPQTETKGG